VIDLDQLGAATVAATAAGERQGAGAEPGSAGRESFPSRDTLSR